MRYPGSLHNHTQMSNFRLRDCTIKENELISRAKELGHSVLAITDHETVAAAVRIEKLQVENPDIKIIMGNEIYLVRNGLNGENFIAGQDKYYHFILLAKDGIGYQQICELSTRAWGRSYISRNMRRVPTYYQDIVEIIGQNPGHVIGSTACLGGMLPTQLLRYKNDPSFDLWGKIINWCQLMRDTFGGEDNFYLELQPSDSKEQIYVNEKLVEIAKSLHLGYIITCDSHYLTAEDREIHKAYLNAQNGDREVDNFYATTYLMDDEDLRNHLNLSNDEIETSYKYIEKIKNSCTNYSIRKSLKIPSLKWNDYSKIQVTKEWIDKIPYFQTFLDSNYCGDQELVKATIQGILRHPDLQNEESYKEINDNLRITWESSNVNKAHWSAYYLNLQKIIDLCWEAGSIVGPGRGSGVGFLLLYCLGITQINPLREETKCFSWRFLNPERVSVLDVDFDIEGRKRQDVLNKFREFYGQDRVSNVTTFRTEKSKSAILTAARGLNIDNDIAQYIASLIPSDRGQLRTLKEVYYGDKDKDFKPVTLFVNEMNNYPELWQTAQKIENLICGTGIHAGGVIFVDEPFTNSTALMKAPDGTICTQFDLHDSEEVSLIKYDALSVEAMDKIHICLDLLCENHFIERKSTLKETYEATIGIYNLERNSQKMWEMVWEHKVMSLFQMKQESGIHGIALSKPKSVNDLSVLNSVIRLMAPDKNSDTPLEMWSRYRKNISLWINEMRQYGLKDDEIEWLRNHSAITNGICESQEGLMSLVQEPKLGGNSLTFADKCRKGIAKKQGKLFQECENIFFENIKKNNCSEKLAHYVWDVLLRVQRGYSFNRSHCLAYSLIALQEMNLAYKYPLIFWNCACLISNSGSSDENSDIETKEKSTDYSKIAEAIGEIIHYGTKVSLVDINTSGYEFEPDVENNQILYGLKAVNSINTDTIEKIIANRPYYNIKDFMMRCPLNKTIMINLIKAGAFDKLSQDFGKELNQDPRIVTMAYYLSVVSKPKTKLTLSNVNELIQKKLIPSDLNTYITIFQLNKYLKLNKWNTYYIFKDPKAFEFYQKNIEDGEQIELIQSIPCILQKTWDKMYSSLMEPIRDWLKNNQQGILEQLNSLLFKEIWNKYAMGTLSYWEMQSLCFYYHEHELIRVNKAKYGIVDFTKLSTDPVVTKRFTIKTTGVTVPIFQISRIAGTVIGKDDNHYVVNLLTTTGVVNVKFTKDYYAIFSRQISELQEDGSKKIAEKGWFTRGTKLLISGYRRDNTFVCKKYKSSGGHQLYKILNIQGGDLELTHLRYGQEEE